MKIEPTFVDNRPHGLAFASAVFSYLTKEHWVSRRTATRVLESLRYERLIVSIRGKSYYLAGHYDVIRGPGSRVIPTSGS